MLMYRLMQSLGQVSFAAPPWDVVGLYHVTHHVT